MSRLEDTMRLTLRENLVTTTRTLLQRVRRIKPPRSPSRSACSPNQSHIHLPRHLRVPLLKYPILLPSHVQLLHHRPSNALVPRQYSRFLLRLRLPCRRLACRASTSAIRQSGYTRRSVATKL